jgi:glutamyl-tRNA synthetase
MGITEVVRGDDLLPSTPWQLALYAALGASPPRFAHVPLVLGPDGTRLSKRHGAVTVADYRAAGYASEDVVGWLAASLGLGRVGPRPRPVDLVGELDLGHVQRSPVNIGLLEARARA